MRMKNALPFLLGSLLILAVSCQKEVDYQNIGGNNPGTGNPGTGTPSNGSIIGNWKFVRMIIDFSSKTKATDGVINEETSLYGSFVSFNEKGTMKVEASTLTTNGIAYSVDTVLTAKFYTNGTLDDEFEMPWAYTMPASSSTVQYQKISNDSIYLQQGLLTFDAPGGSAIPSTPAGMKVSWSGDTLLLTTKIVRNETENIGGTNTQTVTSVKQVVKLIKN
ncbi:MAG: hypothetical protein ACTHMV_01870 [Chitinophagaceae bacterium]